MYFTFWNFRHRLVRLYWYITTYCFIPINPDWTLLMLCALEVRHPHVCLLCRSTQLHATTSCRSQFATTCDSSYVLQSITPVLQSTTPVLVCTTKYYSSTTLYYKVLLQYYSVLQSTTPVLQSTTPVLVCTTKYLHTWNVIYNAPSNKSQPPTSASTAPATQNDSHDWSLSHMKRILQCAEQQESASNFSKYCACHAKWLSWLILVTHETHFTMRRATRVSLQLQQVLRLPRKMTLMTDPCHTWNAFYNARSNKCHCPNSPNTAPVTKNESHDWSLSHMKRYLQCAE